MKKQTCYSMSSSEWDDLKTELYHKHYRIREEGFDGGYIKDSDLTIVANFHFCRIQGRFGEFDLITQNRVLEELVKAFAGERSSRMERQSRES